MMVVNDRHQENRDNRPMRFCDNDYWEQSEKTSSLQYN